MKISTKLSSNNSLTFSTLDMETFLMKSALKIGAGKSGPAGPQEPVQDGPGAPLAMQNGPFLLPATTSGQPSRAGGIPEILGPPIFRKMPYDCGSFLI